MPNTTSVYFTNIRIKKWDNWIWQQIEFSVAILFGVVHLLSETIDKRTLRRIIELSWIEVTTFLLLVILWAIYNRENNLTADNREQSYKVCKRKFPSQVKNCIDILTCWHVDILTCWHVDMLTFWHVDMFTSTDSLTTLLICRENIQSYMSDRLGDDRPYQPLEHRS